MDEVTEVLNATGFVFLCLIAIVVGVFLLSYFIREYRNAKR